MTVTLRLDRWTLHPQGGAAGGAASLAIGKLPPRMIEPMAVEERGSRRTKIWELSSHLHCSIVGTCLSTGELRQVVAKAGLSDDGSEHDLHSQGVSLAGVRDGRAKLLHKALDRRHRATIARFTRGATVDDVRSIWRQTVQQGDIPGGYWASLTHPSTTDALIREIFGEVHMLSHLVGAANRADIRRLSELEAENARLRDKVARQQDHLRDTLSSRDERIRALSELLAHRIAGQPAGALSDDGRADDRADDQADEPALTALVATLERRLRAESNRRAALEERLAHSNQSLGRERRQRETLERREQALSEELQAVEAQLLAPAGEEAAASASLAGLSLLYVGGRTDRVGHLRATSERLGAHFLHHDGGVDDRSGLLGGLVSRADLVVFPVDCVSHEAVTLVKRLCRQMEKPYVPLRSNGMASFAAALRRQGSAAPLSPSSPLPR
jgi:hypothetical protein